MLWTIFVILMILWLLGRRHFIHAGRIDSSSAGRRPDRSVN